ncbi:MAG: hypothetical protein IJ191_01185, partial [Treponema sp.]|nr:hypothetical protein [Treponema sp.]
MAIQNDSPVRTLPPDKIGELLCASLADDSVVFIFPTDVTATAWADWLVTHYETSGVKAVPLERFIAWDTFKTEFVAAHCPQKSSVPALLRKLFVRNVIAENERGVKNGSPVFRMLIAPAYADNAYAYTDWLSSLLPSLKRWHNAYERWQHLHAPVSADAEDEDYLTLYRLYTQYLAEHDLFEPAWQLPDFSGQGKTYILLYPELLDDYADYAETFAAVSSIVVYRLPEVAATVRAETLFPPVDFFSNARTELRVVALRILSLVASGAVSWNDIAVNVPDSITWRPYIEREFALYGIPYVIRSGTPLIKNTAGRIFKEIYDCYTAHFSYDSMRVLLLDDSVPWKAPVVNENLIRAGKEYACVCPYEERGTTIDVWERALSAANSGDTTARERAAYRILKNDITAFKDAQTFADVQSVWFQFRDDFLDAGAFTPSADLIIGRCLQELAALVDIEKNFLLPDGIRTVEPFQFFLNELSQKSYQEQQTHGGVSIFPYRLTAAAPFPVQFVVDASQKSLTVSRPSFWFLSPAKRALLGVAESKDATDAFIRLYAGKGRVFFSGATDTFTGFSIPQSFLQKPSASEQHAHIADILESLAPYDIAAQEQRWFLGKAPFPKTVGSLQAKGFAAWHKLVSHTAVPYAVSDVVARRIDDVVRQRRGFHSGQTDVTHITQTDLNHFFVCPRKWLFLCALRFEEDSLDAV